MWSIPSVNDWDFPSVSELTVFTGERHAAEGGATEVEVRPVRRAARALIGYYNRHCPLGTYAMVQTLHLITSPATFSFLEQHYPTAPTLAFNGFTSTNVPYPHAPPDPIHSSNSVTIILKRVRKRVNDVNYQTYKLDLHFALLSQPAGQF